jgi:ATP-dependent Lhr-like helicase
LRARDVQTFLSHSSLSVDERRRAEAAFADERDCVIVATSTLELGLDVGDLDRVVQIDAPSSVSSFLQRMGRTGRRPGSSRNCLMLTTNHEALLIALGISRLWRDGFIESIEPPPIPAHIFAQQVLALSLQEGGIALGDWDRWLGDVLSDVDSTVRHDVIQHMLEHGILAVDGGVLGLGREGEAAFGRRHFQELVAAFTTPLLLAVRHGSVEVGTIDPLSIEGQPRSTPVILLGGRSWRVLDVDWPRRFVSVEPAAEEGRSRWLGSGLALHAEVARSVEGILSGVESRTSLSHRAESALMKLREDMPFVDGRTLPIVASGKDTIHVWSFAGGRANATIASGLSKENLRVRRADNFSISVASATLTDVSRALRSIDPSALEVPVPERVVTELKFGSCLPPGCACAVLSARLAAPAAIEAALQRPHHCFQTTS